MRVSQRVRAAVVSIVAIACVALPPFQAHASASPVNWEQESPAASPPARTFAASAYDSGRDRIVVFGGTNATFNLGDTWEWDGTTWSNRAPAVSPPNLAAAAMAYDPVRHASVLFGGSSATGVSSDTWEWDGTTWTKRTLNASPPPMVWAAMVYDSTRNRMVLFGEFNQFGVWVSETWELDGSTWTQVHPANSPSPRQGPAMAYDSTRGRTVLFGGWDPNRGRLAETWEWDGTTWLQLAPSVAPYARLWHSMAYDPIRNRTVLFGGDHIQPYSLGDENDTWDWDGVQWTRDWTDAAPSMRAGQSMVYDSAFGRMILFGGFNAGVNPNTYSNETWELGSGIVTPPGSPAITITPMTGEFGSVDLGASSAPAVRGISSSGTGPLTMTISVTGDFAVSFTDCPSSPDPLAAGGTCLMFVTFTPTAEGDRYGDLTFTGNFPGGSLTIALHGIGLARDFTISVNPPTVNTTVGYPVPAVTVSTTAIGDVGTVALSTLPATDPGVTASFSPTSVSAGGSSTMTISVAPSVGPGYYGIRVVGTEGSITRYADVLIHIFPVPDFTIATDPASVTVAHGSSSRVVITSTAINGVASISLSASVAPAGPTATLDQPYMTAGGIGFVTISAGFGVAPGSYTVTITGTEGAKVHSTSVAVTVTTKGLANGGFESADLTGWSQTGVDAVINYAHSGTYAAQVGNPGSPTPFAGDSTLTQTFDVPSSGGKLVFWYYNFCSDRVKNDWFIATLQDGVTGTTTSLVGPACTKNGTWTKVVVNLSSHAGHYVTVTFLNHQGSTTSNTFTLVDDVAMG